jgi:UDP-N-acetylglucosamine 2-epimerase (non-hydrolysing)
MILICFGTRPEYIKFKPLIEKMRGVIPFKTLFTSQHEDLVDSKTDYTVHIKDGRNRLDSIVSSIMDSFDFHKEGITHVMVQGDTATSFAAALSAFHHKIPVIHLEAGMRTYDMENPYPEEFYRQCISKIAHLHFTPSSYETGYLKQDKVKGDVHTVGNTVLDNLVGVSSSYDNVVLVTLHRRENHKHMEDYFNILSKLAKDNQDLKFVLPIHPNPNVKKYKNLLDGVLVVNPLPYDQMISAISKCRFIISDSGGIQEEASFFKKKVIVCREKTERVATIGTSSFMCPSPKELEELFYQIKDNYIIEDECPYGNGTTSKKIVEILKCVI